MLLLTSSAKLPMNSSRGMKNLYKQNLKILESATQFCSVELDCSTDLITRAEASQLKNDIVNAIENWMIFADEYMIDCTGIKQLNKIKDAFYPAGLQNELTVVSEQNLEDDWKELRTTSRYTIIYDYKV